MDDRPTGDAASQAGPPPPLPRAQELRALALLFLRLGVTAFGGPAAHVAMIEEEVVRRRKWMTKEELLDLYGATNLIPGPNSTELVIHIGRLRAGWAGLVVAGACFIVPAALITLALAWAYVRFGALPEVGWLLYGVKPVIIAIVVQALWGLGRAGLKTKPRAALGVLCVAASALGVNEIALLFGSGALVVIARSALNRDKSQKPPGAALFVGPLLGGAGASAAGGATASVGLFSLFMVFAKIGAVLFGSGYVLLAFLRADLVEHRGWLTETQLLDAVAAGQVTPGPVFTTATFLGYVMGGAPGAVAATFGIFLPAFFFVAVSAPLVPKIRRSKTAGAFLDGVNVASLALLAVVAFQLGRTALTDWITGAITVVSAALLVRYRMNSAWLVLGGAALGIAAHLLH